MDYQLQRLILIDSYSPGRVVEFPIGGGAVLTGRADPIGTTLAKTTLLQLVPIFYGENPTRIVGTETNTASAIKGFEVMRAPKTKSGTPSSFFAAEPSPLHLSGGRPASGVRAC